MLGKNQKNIGILQKIQHTNTRRPKVRLGTE